MSWLNLPEPSHHLAPAFQDVQLARAWLAALPRADPLPALSAIVTQVEALDAARLPAPLKLELIDLLRHATVPQAAALEPRYLRKPLPMPADDQHAFEQVARFWQSLAIACLRCLPALAPALRLLPLHRAASALRLAHYAHYQAARELPLLLDRLPFAVFEYGDACGQLQQPLDDPDFRHVEASTVSGQLAWTFLLRAAEPYHLSAAQLAVANRAFSRWRELAGFASEDKVRPAIELAALFGGPLPASLPQRLDYRKILRKLRLRCEALSRGESPESLKLGRELSGAACLRLLRQLEQCLAMPAHAAAGADGEVSLVFGADLLFELVTGRPFEAQATLAPGSATLSHQRVALFGFDRVDALPTAVPRRQLSGESWRVIDGLAVRPAGAQGARRLSPCLVGRCDAGGPRVGRLQGLQCTAEGTLSGELAWYPVTVSAGRWRPPGINPKHTALRPVFLLTDGDDTSLILPPAQAPSLPAEVTVDELPHRHWQLLEVIERGVDFVRYRAARM